MSSVGIDILLDSGYNKCDNHNYDWYSTLNNQSQPISSVCNEDLLNLAFHIIPHTSGFRLKSHEVS